MSAKIIDLSDYQKEQNEEKSYESSYHELRNLMVSLFGPLDHLPETPESTDGERGIVAGIVTGIATGIATVRQTR